MALRLYVSIDLPFSSFLLDIFYLRPLYMKILFFHRKMGVKIHALYRRDPVRIDDIYRK